MTGSVSNVTQHPHMVTTREVWTENRVRLVLALVSVGSSYLLTQAPLGVLHVLRLLSSVCVCVGGVSVLTVGETVSVRPRWEQRFIVKDQSPQSQGVCVYQDRQG